VVKNDNRYNSYRVKKTHKWPNFTINQNSCKNGCKSDGKNDCQEDKQCKVKDDEPIVKDEPAKKEKPAHKDDVKKTEETISQHVEVSKEPVNIENNNYVTVSYDSIPPLNSKAESRYEHITMDKDSKQEFYKGQLYEEAVYKLKNGHFQIRGEQEAADTLKGFVDEQLAAAVIRDGKIFDEKTPERVKHYYVIKCLYYVEAITKLKNKEFGNIQRPEEIADRIDKFVNSKILDYIK
jgi:hypothetical protein